MLLEMTKPTPPAPTIPKIAHSEKLISKRIPVHATICAKEEGNTAFINTPSLPTPVASNASSVSEGILSKLCAKDFVKKLKDQDNAPWI